MANDKTEDTISKAKKIRVAAKKAGGDTAKRLERMLERAKNKSRV